MTISIANPLPALPRAADPVNSRLIIVGCCPRKRVTRHPVPALDLYDEGCIPPLRARLGTNPRLRNRIRILSARHGLVHADTPLLAYDQALDADTAARLRPAVTAALADDLAATGTPCEVLAIVEPLYLVPIADLLTTGARVHWVPDYFTGWPEASAVLDSWSWT
ncbi:hypothetical protein [Micromonospora sp. NBC_01813]|uniref:hypothetical protein n=1 Tax=Micromonospora sp. NBC_01813 TaxID=2975988 RepID=UPI002DD965E0|nr:hypothetical protein [Micromonospora sp. NBC_01813]WSA07044.1 hypothetical protein OG958_22640 [Micromonospora sp. NBC_01813]